MPRSANNTRKPSRTSSTMCVIDGTPCGFSGPSVGILASESCESKYVTALTMSAGNGPKILNNAPPAIGVTKFDVLSARFSAAAACVPLSDPTKNGMLEACPPMKKRRADCDEHQAAVEHTYAQCVTCEQQRKKCHDGAAQCITADHQGAPINAIRERTAYQTEQRERRNFAHVRYAGRQRRAREAIDEQRHSERAQAVADKAQG